MSRSIEIDNMTTANIQQLRVINVATLPVTYTAKVGSFFLFLCMLLAIGYLYLMCLAALIVLRRNFVQESKGIHEICILEWNICGCCGCKVSSVALIHVGCSTNSNIPAILVYVLQT